MSHSPTLYGYPVAIVIGIFIGILIGSGQLSITPRISASTSVPRPANAPASPDIGTGSASSASAPATPAATSCDVAREAFLTGTEADIINSMNGVLADRTAHDTARQFAKFYNGRDRANKSKQEMDIKTVQFYCSL